MLGFGRTIFFLTYEDLGARFRTSGMEDQGEGIIPSVLVVFVAGQSGQWRSRTAATVAGTPELQRADAVPEMVVRMLGPRWCSIERSLLSGLRRGERMEEIGRGRDEPRRWAKGRAGKGDLVQLTSLSASFAQLQVCGYSTCMPPHW